MAVTITLSYSLTVTDNDADTDSTHPVMVVEKSIAGLVEVDPRRFVVNNTTKTLWSSANANPSSFSFLAVWSSIEVEVELTCNEGDASEAIFTVKLVPNVPFVLGSDDSRYNAGDLSGTADVIDLIRVKNSASTDAIVNMVIAV